MDPVLSTLLALASASLPIARRTAPWKALQSGVIVKQHFQAYWKFVLLLSSLLYAGIAPAQSDLSQFETLPGAAIDPVGDLTRDVLVGQTLSDIRISVRNQPQPEASFSEWRVSPSSKARITQSMPVIPANSAVEIEFLEAGTVRVSVVANATPATADGAEQAAPNQVTYVFNVTEAPDSQAGTDQETGTDEQAGTDQQASTGEQTGTVPQTTQPSVPPLNDNQLAARTAFESACTDAAADPDGNNVNRSNLLVSCENLASDNNSASALDRLAAEELFALGDTLTVSDDRHISNIQSRINRIRMGQRDAFDVEGLRVRIKDQHLPAAIISASKHAWPWLQGGGASQDAVEQSALGLFTSGNIAFGKIDGNGIQRDVRYNSSSLTAGADYRLSDQRVIGAAIGMVNEETDFKGDNGTLDRQSISVSVFGSWYEQDKGYADVIAELGQNEFDLSRRINLPGQASEFASGSTNARRIALSINVGRTFHRGATEYGPTGRIAITRASIDGFTETSSLNNGAGTTLNVRSHSLGSLRLSVGGEIKHMIGLSQKVLIPTARIDYEVETETDKGVIATSFVNDPSNNEMTLRGTRRSRASMLISVGMTAVLKHDQNAFVSLETHIFNDHLEQQRLRLGYRMQF